MGNDPLSDTLALLDARCVVSAGFTASGRWALRFPRPSRLKIHAVLRGHCLLSFGPSAPPSGGSGPGGAPTGAGAPAVLGEGDVAVFDGSYPFVFASDPETAPVDATGLFTDARGEVVHLGAGARGAAPAPARHAPPDHIALGGHVELAGGAEDLLLTALPPLIHIRSASAEAPALRRLLDELLREMTTDLAGAAFARDQLAQLLFVQVLRAHLADTDALPAGRLRALADERLAPALRLMHEEPGRPWGLHELARAAAMSRTTFASRFREAAGVPPLAYLKDWRMRLARRALRTGATTVAELAGTLGYTSESAFSNAFKRETGVSPRRYRDDLRHTRTAPAGSSTAGPIAATPAAAAGPITAAR
ncbi:AraC family transcriptional regulator [Streptomyces tremellae]|uniref:AraC family transcriptional regulator n=1 Tax=Streptomyces tremellae TaxID=1124239 RepID=A0ABP7FMC4_9ACTN